MKLRSVRAFLIVAFISLRIVSSNAYCNAGVYINESATCDCTGTSAIGDFCEVDCLNGAVNSDGSATQCDCTLLHFIGLTCDVPCNDGVAAAYVVNGAPSNYSSYYGYQSDFSSSVPPSNYSSYYGYQSNFSSSYVDVFSFSCDCSNTAFIGYQCEIPCLNGGSNSDGSFTQCDCTGTGFAGPICNFSCNAGVTASESATCDCTGTSAIGDFCEVDCLNGAVNSDGSATQCDCTHEFGATCDTSCNNGVPSYDFAKCDCYDTNTTGLFCEKPCLNGGLNTIWSSVQCNCESTAFIGDYCERDACVENSHRCLNGGSCLADPNIYSYSCNCAQNFSGSHCEVFSGNSTKYNCEWYDHGLLYTDLTTTALFYGFNATGQYTRSMSITLQNIYDEHVKDPLLREATADEALFYNSLQVPDLDVLHDGTTCWYNMLQMHMCADISGMSFDDAHCYRDYVANVLRNAYLFYTTDWSFESVSSSSMAASDEMSSFTCNNSWEDVDYSSVYDFSLLSCTDDGAVVQGEHIKDAFDVVDDDWWNEWLGYDNTSVHEITCTSSILDYSYTSDSLSSTMSSCVAPEDDGNCYCEYVYGQWDCRCGYSDFSFATSILLDTTVHAMFIGSEPTTEIVNLRETGDPYYTDPYPSTPGLSSSSSGDLYEAQLQEECRQLCESDDACRGYEYDHSTGECTLTTQNLLARSVSGALNPFSCSTTSGVALDVVLVTFISVIALLLLLWIGVRSIESVKARIRASEKNSMGASLKIMWKMFFRFLNMLSDIGFIVLLVDCSKLDVAAIFAVVCTSSMAISMLISVVFLWILIYIFDVNNEFQTIYRQHRKVSIFIIITSVLTNVSAIEFLDSHILGLSNLSANFSDEFTKTYKRWGLAQALIIKIPVFIIQFTFCLGDGGLESGSFVSTFISGYTVFSKLLKFVKILMDRTKEKKIQIVELEHIENDGVEEKEIEMVGPTVPMDDADPGDVDERDEVNEEPDEEIDVVIHAQNDDDEKQQIHARECDVEVDDVKLHVYGAGDENLSRAMKQRGLF